MHWPIFALALLPLAGGASAQGVELPSGGVVTAGQAAIGAPDGNAITITQSSAKAIIDWGGFAIGGGGSVRFDNGAGATLNRVTGGAASTIDGLLSASGSVYLINPNGVIVGRSGVVDVGGSFVASTLDVADAAFLGGGELTFSHDSAAAVVNLGRIGALGGDVALIGRIVENRGAITAARGTVGLAAGGAVLLRDAALDGGRFVVELGGDGTSATNSGGIAAAAAELRANGGNVYALAGNGAGTIRATGVAAAGGRIYLTAGPGAVTAAGDIAARGADGAGGFVETSGASVDFSAARIDAGQGGTWLLDPTDLVIDQPGGNAIAATLNAGSNVTQSTSAAGSGGNGDIFVNAGVNIAWNTAAALTLSAYRNIAIGENAKLTSTGGGAVTLRGDNAGASDGGLVTFGNGASVSTAGLTTIYTTSGMALPSPIELSTYRPYVTGGYISYFLLNTPGSLDFLRFYPGGAFALNRDIDLAGVARTPIVTPGRFSSYSAFSGILDGQGHSILNMNVSGDAQSTFGGSQDGALSGVGLFTVLSGATVRNLNLVGGTVTGSSGVSGGGVGALAGVSYGGTISNVTSSVSVTGTGVPYVGGLIGRNQSGTIVNSSTSGKVTGVPRITVIGCSPNCDAYHQPVTITTATNYTGGLVGGNLGTVTNSYSTAAVDGAGSEWVGGFAGGNAGLIDGVYATGRIIASAIADHTGGLVGTNTDNGAGGAILTNAYWDLGTTGQVLGFASNTGSITRVVGIGGDTGLSPFAQSTYQRFSFGAGGTWFMVEGSTRPFLQSEYATTIRTAHQLQLVDMNRGASYTLGADIDLAETRNPSGLWNVATGFDPIGRFTTEGGFGGTLDGAGHAINGLYINRPSEDGIGLIALIGASGRVANLRLTNADVVGGGSTGALAGGANGAVEGVYSFGRVTGTTMGSFRETPSAGGLVGTLRGTIARSASAAAVSGALNLGGLVGVSYGTISESHASGSVTATAATAGGLVGYNSGNVSDSYATGAVAGGTEVGGLIGRFATTSPPTVAVVRTYASGAVTATGRDPRVGGLIGSDDSDVGAIRDSYWDVATTGQARAAGSGRGVAASVVPVGGASMRDPYAQATYTAFDFSAGGRWVILDGQTRPLLRAEATREIADGHQLQLMALNPAATYYLSGDIDLSGTSNPSEIWRTATGFVPIGTAATPFVGLLDGRGHGISNLAINRPTTDAVGLFGTVGKNGVVTSLALLSGTVVGHDLVGALVGKGEGLTYGARSAVAVNGTGNNVGGLIGGNFGPGLAASSATGEVHGLDFVGGLVGYNTGAISSSSGNQVVGGRDAVGGIAGFNDVSGNISSAMVTSSVTGTGYVGGVAGYNSGRIGDSATAGTVVGNNQVGGIAGLSSGVSSFNFARAAVSGTAFVGGVLGTNSGTVESSHADGAVSATTYVGGLAGKNDGTVTASYANGAVTGTSEHVGGLVGLSSGTIAGSYAMGSVSGGNFTGGLTGFNGGQMTDSYATGTVAGRELVGGLVGLNDTAGVVSRSNAFGAVSGGGYVGGLAGYNSGRLDTVVASGSATAEFNQVGGLVGVNSAIVTAGRASGPVNGLLFVGGLAGTNGGAITTSYATGAASGEAYVGGLVGKNDVGSISLSHAEGAVTATQDGAGGLVGSNNRGRIDRVYATGATSGRNYVGGLLGYNDGMLTDAYATGGVGGAFFVGGVAGGQGAGGSIARVYAAGAVGGSGSAGGLVGDNAAMASVTASYWDVGTTGQAGAVGGNRGQATDLTAIGGDTGLNPRAQGTYRNFDFATVWTIQQTRSRPYFQDMQQNPPPN